MHYYNIYISGYGAEVCWHPLSKEAYDFYEENDDILTEHLFEENNDVPDFANLTENGSKTWDELDGITREYYCSCSNSYITITEVDENDAHIGDVVDNIDMTDFLEINNAKIRPEEKETTTEKYGLQIFSSEKGTFWDCSIISDEPLDLSKFTISVQPSLNEDDDMITDVMYNDVSLDNNGGDTRGKGIDTYLVEF